MGVWTSLTGAVSSAAKTVSNTASTINNLGVGNQKDPVRPHYRGHHALRVVREASIPTPINIHLPNHPTAPTSTDGPCPNGFRLHTNKQTNTSIYESCEATSKAMAPDGCAYEGRHAECQDNQTGVYQDTLVYCNDTAFYRLAPPCEKGAVAFCTSDQPKTFNATDGLTIFVAACSLYLVAKDVIIRIRDWYKGEPEYELVDSSDQNSVTIEMSDRQSQQNGASRRVERELAPESSFNTPS